MNQTDDTAYALVIDDEPDIVELLQLTLERMNVPSIAATSLAEAKRQIGNHRLSLCLTDMRLPDGNGMDIVRLVQKNMPEVPVAVITAHGNMDLAIEALKAGAFDFVNKPVELKVLRELIQTALKLGDVSITPRNQSARNTLLGRSPQIQAIREAITKVARSQAPVYISGESGTGKELVARMIHEQGPRADKPFVPVNCGAIPAELMESELFGHKKGSFTGANSDKEGLFQVAHGGTLFLDEVADLPLPMQVKLLRAIQEKTVRPVGAASETHVDVRILSATHRNLAEEVAEGRFREDLFYRINVIQLALPSLRERPEDIPDLARYCLQKLSGFDNSSPPTLTEEALAQLESYSFPGNVRELENILERAITFSENDRIGTHDLQLPQSAPPPEHSLNMKNESSYNQSLEDGFDLERHLEEIEKALITRAIAESDNNKTSAARKLGISFRALRYRLKKLNLE